MASGIEVEKLKAVCEKIVREGDLDMLTDRDVRRYAEKEFGLEEKALDEKPYKKLIKDTVAAVVEELAQENEANDKDSDKEQQDEDNDEEQQNEDDDKVDSSSSGNESEEGDMDASDSETKSRAKRKSEEIQPLPKSKRTKMSSTSKNISAGSKTTIDNLKSYINKCGLRKVWSKELAGMNGTQQIRHLKAILEGLGMDGRPTVEKCKKIKAKRELQAELAAMNQDNIIDDLNESSEHESSSRKRRSVARKGMSYNVDQISDSEASDANEDETEAAGGSEAGRDGDKNEANDNEMEETDSESDAYTEDNDSDSGEAKDDADSDSDEASANNLDEDESD
ncbi:hypothetical protein GGI23_001476 [Coemansia sp. RSA 2559]|nr:hypothetical protein GGI23_001476 [Coemansia sp. RSA 2559]